jgi:hypothetical protein
MAANVYIIQPVADSALNARHGTDVALAAGDADQSRTVIVG